jgi:hypothetical protein
VDFFWPHSVYPVNLKADNRGRQSEEIALVGTLLETNGIDMLELDTLDRLQ